MPNRATATFRLKKHWHYSEPGIDLVEIRYICAATGEQPDWTSGEESKVLVPRGDGELPCRSGAIELPCGLGGAPAYALHYYFLVIQHGRQRTLPVIGEEIVSREVAYRDEWGRCAAVGVQWSVGDTATPNYTLLVGEQCAPAPPGVPRTFKGCVWGPRGATVYHVFHLQPLMGPDASAGRELWHTNGGRMWQAVL